MKNKIIILLCVIIFSCNSNTKISNCSDKFKSYKMSLHFLKKYLAENEYKTFNIQEIQENINVLESTSKIIRNWR